MDAVPVPSRPLDDSVDWQRGNYALTTRGGRVESFGDAKEADAHGRGRIGTGGVDPSRSGAAMDVAPENFAHPVYRAGFALAIAIPWRAS